MVPVWSSDSSAGRMNGTSAPCWRATSAISISSVETMILSKQALCSAASMDQAIIGLPQNGLMFLRGMRLLPPRAGMIASFMPAAPRAEPR
ncbi:hypothetical protein D3C81_2112020 [compost metagenome]